MIHTVLLVLFWLATELIQWGVCFIQRKNESEVEEVHSVLKQQQLKTVMNM